MSKKIIFYGGVKGLNKSDILQHVINTIGKDKFRIVKISDTFQKFIKEDKGNNSIINWDNENWKKHDEMVIDNLYPAIQKGDTINIINSHFSVPYMNKNNYVSGIETYSLERLLKKTFCSSKGDIIKGIKSPCFGLLLIDTEPQLILNYLNQNNSKLSPKNHIHIKDIIKDLEYNRIWAEHYCNAAGRVLGKENVYHKTIYITKDNNANDLMMIKTKISNFFRIFID